MSIATESKSTYFSISNLKQLLTKRKARQISSLYASMVFGFAVSFGVSIVNTRLLGPQVYGDLKFLQNIFGICVTCLTFGYFATGSTLLAQRKNEPIKRELFGNLLVVGALISLILILGLFVFSYFEDDIFNNELGKVIRIFSPFLFVFVFQECLEKALIGDNRIYELSLFSIAPQTLYLICAMAFTYFMDLTLFSALAIQLVIMLVVITITCVSLKVKFGNVKRNFKYIWEENKKFGVQVYIGVLAAVVSGQFANIWIGYFMENSYVGFFSLALSLTLPLTMIPNAVSSTFFKEYANNPSIPRKVMAFTVAISIGALGAFMLMIDKLIIFVYSSKFSSVIPIIYPIAVGSVLHGFGDLYNQFLWAHGQGKTMRNGSIVVGIANLVGYFLFVKYFGIKGASMIKLISSSLYFFVRFYPYHRMVKKISIV